MTARQLLDTDPTFRSFLDCWVRDRRCPFPLVDYLLELGLEGQAEGARWAEEQPLRRLYNIDPVYEGRCFPAFATSSDSWFWDQGGSTLDSTADELPAELMRAVDKQTGNKYYLFNSLELAFCGLLDGFADYLTENPNAIQSLRCTVPS